MFLNVALRTCINTVFIKY